MRPGVMSSRSDASTATAWSAREMIDRLGGDEELARQLVALFLTECPRLLARLRDSLASGQADDVRRAAHAARGCIANFVEGGPQLTAFEIERLGMEGHLDLAAPVIVRLEQELAAMVAVMRDFEAGGRARSDC